MESPQKIVVIGAGIIGACCALELILAGHQVTLIEPGEPGGEQAASYGNGAWLSPSSVVPMSMPGLWKKVPGYLLNAASPLRLRWWAVPALTPWLVRFIRAGSTVARVEKTAAALSALLHDAPERHLQLAQLIGRAELVRRDGLLYPYPDRQAFEADALAWRLRRDNGIVWQVFEGDALRQFMPALGERYQYGVWVPAGANCTNPGAYVEAIVGHAKRLGLNVVKAHATGFKTVAREGVRKLEAVVTPDGNIACTRAVIAAGVHSKALARAAGDRVFLESERGYHVVFDQPGMELRPPVMPGDAKMAITSTQTGFRVSGQVELASVKAAPDWRRADILRRFAVDNFPPLSQRQEHLQSVASGIQSPPGMKRWMGHRPSTPDGLPVLGAGLACPDIFHAFGHGHVGLASGPVSGKIIADLISRGASSIATDAYSIRRFA